MKFLKMETRYRISRKTSQTKVINIADKKIKASKEAKRGPMKAKGKAPMKAKGKAKGKAPRLGAFAKGVIKAKGKAKGKVAGVAVPEAAFILLDGEMRKKALNRFQSLPYDQIVRKGKAEGTAKEIYGPLARAAWAAAKQQFLELEAMARVRGETAAPDLD